jgi:hypothetical protein
MRARVSRQTARADGLAEQIVALRAELAEVLTRKEAMRQLFAQQARIVASLRGEQSARARLEEALGELGQRNQHLEQRGAALDQQIAVLQQQNAAITRLNADLDQRATAFEQRSFFFEQQCELFHARNLKLARFTRRVPAPVRRILKRLLSRASAIV